jgi:uncharacterized delta-60 repeat protein
MLWAVAVATLGVLVPNAQGRAGSIDLGFGNGGQLVIPASDTPSQQVIPVSEDRILIVERGAMTALLPSGEVDPGFGEGGTASLIPPPGGRCGIADVASDSFGRLLVAGSCSFKGEGPPPAEPGEVASQVLLERLTPDGKLDRSFGGGDGMLVSDFGLPPGDPGLPTIVGARDVAVDALGRIIVAGARQSGLVRIPTTTEYQHGSEPFVVRIAPDGAAEQPVDGGALIVPGLGENESLVVDAQGGSLFSFREGVDVSLLRLGDGSGPDPSYGEGGWRRFGLARLGLARFPLGLLGIDPEGRAVLAGRLSGYRTHHVQNGVVVKRLNPDGSLDRTIGNNGLVMARFPRLYYSSEALDNRGGVLVAMTLRAANHSDIRTTKLMGATLARLRPNGRLDRSFGQHGILELPFDPKHDLGLGSLNVLGNDVYMRKTRCDHGCRTVVIRVKLEP